MNTPPAPIVDPDLVTFWREPEGVGLIMWSFESGSYTFLIRSTLKHRRMPVSVTQLFSTLVSQPKKTFWGGNKIIIMSSHNRIPLSRTFGLGLRQS